MQILHLRRDRFGVSPANALIKPVRIGEASLNRGVSCQAQLSFDAEVTNFVFDSNAISYAAEGSGPGGIVI